MSSHIGDLTHKKQLCMASCLRPPHAGTDPASPACRLPVLRLWTQECQEPADPGAWVPGDSREELSSAAQQPAVTARSSGSQAALQSKRAEAPEATGRAATTAPAEDLSASDISSLSEDGQGRREALYGRAGGGSIDAARVAEVQPGEASSRGGPIQAEGEPPTERQGGGSHPVRSGLAGQQGTESRDGGQVQATTNAAKPRILHTCQNMEKVPMAGCLLYSKP